MPESDQTMMLGKAFEANNSSRMADLYQHLTDMWNGESSNALLTFFATTHLTQVKFLSAPFGATEYIGQPRTESPKYDFFLHLLKNAALRQSESTDN